MGTTDVQVEGYCHEEAARIFFNAERSVEFDKIGKVMAVMAKFESEDCGRFDQQIIEICRTMTESQSITCTVVAVTAFNPTQMRTWLTSVLDNLILGEDTQAHHVLGGVLGLFEAGANLPRPEKNPYLFEPTYEDWMKTNIQRIVDTSAGGCYKAFPYLKVGDFRKGSQDKEYKMFKSDLGGAVSRCLAAVDGGRREMVFSIASTYVEKDNRLRRWVCPVAFLVMRQLCTSCFNNLIVGEPERVLALYAKSLNSSSATKG